MNKIALALIALTTFCFAERPQRSSPFEGPPPQRDTIFVVVSEGDTAIKEYHIMDVADRRNEKPPIKIIRCGAILTITLSPLNVGSAGALRDVNDNSLVWKGEVPKSQQFEINTSGWKQGKYYGGIFNYKFGIIKE